MSKLIFILFLFFCSLHSFSQKALPNSKTNNTGFSNKIKESNAIENIETAKFQEPEEKEIITTCKDTICDVLTIKVSDLLDESMIKKLLANV
jgi:DNA-binding Xre family transcriptional regulator